MERLRRLRQEMGSVNALLFLVMRALRTVSFGHARIYKYYLTAQPVGVKPLCPPGRGRAVVVTEASQSEFIRAELIRPPHVIRQRIDHGGRCLLAHKDGKLIGFQWFTLSDYPEDEVRCLFQLRREDNCAWDYDIYVSPDARFLPVFPRLWDTCNSLLRSEGVSLTLSRIDAFNPASRRSHEALGAREIGWAVFLCVAPVQISVLSMRPWLHVSFSASRFPKLPISHIARLHR